MKPSEKQILYAKNISKTLGIELPEEKSSKSYWDFINSNKHKIKEKNEVDFYYHMQEIMNKYNFYFDSSSFEMIRKELSGKHGIYFMFSKNQLVYVGKSKNLGERIISSLNERNSKECVIEEFGYYETETEIDAAILEMIYISYFRPILNKEFITSDKITVLNCFDIINKNVIPSEVKRYKAFKIKE